MARYYFDVHDGKTFVRDPDGTELSSADQARNTAFDMLPDIAQDVLPCQENREIVIYVSDHAGSPVLQASLSVNVKWLGISRSQCGSTIGTAA